MRSAIPACAEKAQPHVIRTRILPVAALSLLVAGCAHRGVADLDETGGQKITRSVCPAVAVPTYTGDVSLFAIPQSKDARSLDVTATITNLQSSCDSTGATVQANVTFDVLARRASPSGARDIVLPYFSTVMQAGTKIVSKQVGQVQVHFDDGQTRGFGRAAAGANINKASATLPDRIAMRLNRKRKATDADASVDPMSDPTIRGAVQQASFELLIGFQLNADQLAYNATR